MDMLRDLDIRNAIHHQLCKDHHDDPSTVIVDELGILGGSARADIAVVNGQLSAFEIKSARDTLERLPRQVELYNLVFDYITLVASEVHLENVLSIIPDVWGVFVATADESNEVNLHPYRYSNPNPYIDPRAVVELLWREEALDFLAEIGADRGVRSKPRAAIWDRVCSVYSLDEIKERVRCCLKRRKGPESLQSLP